MLRQGFKAGRRLSTLDQAAGGSNLLCVLLGRRRLIRLASLTWTEPFFLDEQRGWLLTWGFNDDGSYLYSTVDGGKHWTAHPDLSFQGKGRFASVVRFTSKERGFVFFVDKGQNRLVYTVDAGAHWHKQALPSSVYACQVFEGDLLCSVDRGFRLLTLHPR